jgi:uncharacterized protein (DUF983 family)
MKTLKGSKLSLIVQEKCPNCGKGHIYYNRKSVFSFIPKMRENCEACNYHFEREPGYFMGAMYVNYGLTVFEGIFTFLIINFLFDGISNIGLVLSILSVIFLLSMRNFRLSRILWMHIFPQ